MTELEIEFREFDIRRIAERAVKAMRRAVELAATDVWGEIRREAPVDEGRLAGSFQMRRLNAMAHRIVTNVEYAVPVHDGTKAHLIRPKSGGGVLAFSIAGGMTFAKFVRHPGTKANKFVDRAISTTSDRIDSFMRRAVAEVA